MKVFFTLFIFCNSVFCMAQNTSQTKTEKQILINNVEIFNGKDSKTVKGNVLIVNNLINKISPSPIATNKSAMVTIIDGKGMFLMPGLIDAHTHIMMEAIPLAVALNSDIQYIDYVAGNAAQKELLRGFTTIRDMAGPSFGLKRAIDAGIVDGPRIYPSGGAIGQTSGHSDYNPMNEVPRPEGSPLSYMERNNFGIIADGPDQVLLRTREQLKLGATQIKLMAGGGVSSNFDPLDVTQYTLAEFKAAVDAATNWGTYVTVHAYTPDAIKVAVEAGIKCLEHGQLMDEATAKLLADKGVWLCLQPFLDDQDVTPFMPESMNRKKQIEMTKGTDKAYKLAKKYKIKTAFGTDCLFDAKLTERQGAQLAKLINWYSPFEILKMATSTNAELLAMSGKRNPYQEGKLGVIEEGAYADMLLVNKNPLEDINVVANPGENFVLIMKDGIIYKNSIK
jgi:imidazolonepropionase-like amidohydrolase